jgi:hypothetical protein
LTDAAAGAALALLGTAPLLAVCAGAELLGGAITC